MKKFSGDDHFLLQAAYEMGMVPKLILDHNIGVKTSSLSGFLKNLIQRKRWISKTSWIKDPWGGKISKVVASVLFLIYGMWLSLGLLNPAYFFCFVIGQCICSKGSCKVNQTSP